MHHLRYLCSSLRSTARAKVADLQLQLLFTVLPLTFLTRSRNTPIGFLNRLLCLHLPASLRRGDQKITGGRADAYVTQLAQYLFHEKHPLVLVRVHSAGHVQI